MLMVDLMFHSCCQVQLKNLTTRMVANQTINIKRFFWRQVEMRNLTYTLSPHSPRSLRSLTPKKGVKGAHGLGRQAAFSTRRQKPLMLMV